MSKGIKCFFSEKGCPPRCDKPAEYIYIGKSYCAEHVEIICDRYGIPAAPVELLGDSENGIANPQEIKMKENN